MYTLGFSALFWLLAPSILSLIATIIFYVKGKEEMHD